MRIVLKSKEEIGKIKEASRIVGVCLEKLKDFVRPGVSTLEIDQYVETIIRQEGGVPGFKGYQGFPASACVSINEEVVHGIPTARRLVCDGDLVSVDIGVVKKGYNGDGAFTYIVGKVDDQAIKMIDVTRKSLAEGIKEAVPGKRLGDISHRIQSIVEKAGFSIVRDLVGHGIGKELHEPPQIPNFGKKKTGPILKEGMTLAIEPMVNMGGYKVNVLEDGWTVVTADRSLSVHFEHTIAIRSDGPEILTTVNK